MSNSTISNCSPWSHVRSTEIKRKQSLVQTTVQSKYSKSHNTSYQPYRLTVIRASSSSNNSTSSSGKKWQDGWWRRKVAETGGSSVTQRVLSGILRLPGVPIGSYVAEPYTFLHQIDPRIKQIWLVAVMILPARSTLPCRFGVDALLVVLAVTLLPRPVWKPQLSQLSLLCGAVFLATAFAADNVASISTVRLPPPELEGLAPLPELATTYKYVLLHWGPFQVTRKGVQLACSTSLLSFCLLQSSFLVLSTTTPEAMAFALKWTLRPLQYLGLPVDELVLGTLLALRFISLVFEELRGLAVGVASRGIDWRTLQLMDILRVFFGVFRRLASKLGAHAEVISEAMVARGYTSAAEHNTMLDLDPQRSNRVADALALLMLFGLSYAVFQTDTL